MAVFTKVNQLNLTRKFILFLCIISVLPLLVVGLVSYEIAKATIQQEVSNYTQELMVKQTAYIISIAKTKLKKVKKEKWQYNAKIVQFYSNIL